MSGFRRMLMKKCIKTLNEISGKFTKSGTYTIRINNSSVSVTADANGNFSYKFSDRVTSLYNFSSSVKSYLKEVDFSKCNLDYCTDINSMLADCTVLTSLDFGDNKLNAVTTANEPITRCTSLLTANAGSIELKNATKIKNLFSGSNVMTELDLHSLTAENATYFQGFVSSSIALEKLDIKSLACNKAKNFGYSINNNNFGSIGYLETNDCILSPNMCLTAIDSTGADGNQAKALFQGAVTGTTSREHCTSIDLTFVNMQRVTNTTDMLNGRTRLTTLILGQVFFASPQLNRVFDLSKVTTWSRESARQSLYTNLADISGSGHTTTIKLSSTVYNYFTQSELATMAQKGFTITK